MMISSDKSHIDTGLLVEKNIWKKVMKIILYYSTRKYSYWFLYICIEHEKSHKENVHHVNIVFYTKTTIVTFSTKLSQVRHHLYTPISTWINGNSKVKNYVDKPMELKPVWKYIRCAAMWKSSVCGKNYYVDISIFLMTFSMLNT